jgi:hypothetical protein
MISFVNIVVRNLEEVLKQKRMFARLVMKEGKMISVNT